MNYNFVRPLALASMHHTNAYCVARAASASSRLNCWHVQVPKLDPESLRSWRGSNHPPFETFAIMPAHVAVYKKDGRWKRSEFLEQDKGGLSKLPWRVPTRYTRDPWYSLDFAWAKIDNPEAFTNPLPISWEEKWNWNCSPATFFHRQPLGCVGFRKGLGGLSLAAVRGMVYQSNDPELLEAQNVGFVGFSGALVVHRDETNLRRVSPEEEEPPQYTGPPETRRSMGEVLGIVVGVREDPTGSVGNGGSPLSLRRAIILPAWEFPRLVYRERLVGVEVLNGKSVRRSVLP